MQLPQSIQRLWKRGPVFEVCQNTIGNWYVHERASNGKIKSVTEDYATKSNAVRAAKGLTAETPGATWRVF